MAAISNASSPRDLCLRGQITRAECIQRLTDNLTSNLKTLATLSQTIKNLIDNGLNPFHEKLDLGQVLSLEKQVSCVSEQIRREILPGRCLDMTSTKIDAKIKEVISLRLEPSEKVAKEMLAIVDLVQF